MSDFSNKAAFLKHVEEMLPDDAHYFQFVLMFNSHAGLRPAAVPAAKLAEGLDIKEVAREPIDIGGRFARYTIEGKL